MLQCQIGNRKIWLSRDSVKIQLRNQKLLGETLLNLKVGNQQILRANFTKIKIGKLGSPKQKLCLNFWR